jgi:hypothetical protein
MTRLGNRARTVLSLLGHFAMRGRWFLIPFLLILLLAGALLLVTGGLSYVAPFLYGIF